MYKEVSILVLMDLPFLQEERWKIREFFTTFQSLFLWIFRSYTSIWQTLTRWLTRFQSLFLWIFRSYDLIRCWVCQDKSVVSILVLMDLPFLHNKALTIVLKYKRFQSLFLWIFRSYSIMTSTTNTATRMFQSLFLWIFRSYTTRINSLQKNDVFQSLFLWIFRSYCKLYCRACSRIQVSILVLMDLPFLPKTGHSEIENTHWVSILVLMDLPFLRRHFNWLVVWQPHVSILVLMDLPFLHNRAVAQYPARWIVSILVLMDLPFLQRYLL